MVSKDSDKPALGHNSEEEKATSEQVNSSTFRPKQEGLATQKGIANAQTAYGKRFRRLNDELNACGISNYIDTPTIAIIGSQSAGKSSVLEALSEIAFPRASGTCTRCPTEVRMFNAAQPWTCKISLRLETGAQGQSLNEIQHVPFGSPLTDKALVQQRIRAAQRAILNPSKDSSTFLNDDLDSEGDNEIGFSENTICLEVRGENLVDLSIIDLPGIISNAGEKGDAASIDLIKSLVRKTIAKPNCLILTTITMADDFQNQMGVTLAKEADPKGSRTLGVLTKADRIGEGDHDSWISLLKGESNRLMHGYYATVNPSSEQLKQNISFAKARAAEKALFEREPWRSIGGQAARRLGSQALGQRLEHLLEKLIQEKLPATIEAVHKMCAETDAMLAKLPEKVADGEAMKHLFRVCQGFAVEYQKLLENKKSQDALLLAWPLKLLTVQFRQKIFATRPVIIPFTSTELQSQKLRPIADEGICLDGPGDNMVDGREGVHQESDVPSDKVDAVLKAMGGEGAAKLAKLSNVRALKLNLTDVQDAMSSEAESRLPDNTSWAVKEELLVRAIEPFKVIALELFDDVLMVVRRATRSIVDEKLDKRFGSPLRDLILDALGKLIEKHASECHKLIEQAIVTENTFVFTLNHHYYVDKRDTYIARLCKARLDEGLHGVINQPPPPAVEKDAKIIQFLADHNFNVDKLSDLSTHRIPTNVKEKIKLGAEVRAYWQVAFKRFADYVRMTLTVHLCHPIAENCFLAICQELGLLDTMGADKAQALLRQPEDVCAQREGLELQKERLDRAADIIERFRKGRFDPSS